MLGYNYTYNDTYLHESTGRVSYAQNIYDATLDRSYEYDHLGRLAISHTGTEARAHVFDGNLWGTMDGPYSQGYDYDVWGNVTHKYGWGGEVQGGSAGQSSDIYYSYLGNRRNGFGYDAAGNLTNDGAQSFSYDATGQQSYASGLAAGGSAPTFTDDPLVSQVTVIKLVHLTELRAAVDQLRARAGLSAASWTTDPNPQQFVTTVHHNHIVQLRAKLEEALAALHLPVGSYAHSGPNQGDTIYAIDFQELRNKIKDAWTALASSALSQSYDGDGLRVKKTEYGSTTWYLRSSVLGGQVVAEIDGNAVWQRGYVYVGSSLMAVQQGGVFWMHEDPITKSKRMTDSGGNIISTVELDPWGADTNRSGNQAFQPKKYTSYDRDGNGTDEAMFRRYNRKNSRFDQPDPYEGSYDFSDPQSLNRYAYTQNDPVNSVDPSGLNAEQPGSSCSTNGHYNNGIIGNDGKCYAGPGATVTVGGGGDPFTLTGSAAILMLWNPTGRSIGDRDPGSGGGPQNPYDIRTIISDAKKKAARPLTPFEKARAACVARETAKADAERSQYVANYPKRIRRSAVFGGVRGAAMGAYAGANGGEFLEPLGGGVPGAIGGGVIGGILGTGAGVVGSLLTEPAWRWNYDRSTYRPALNRIAIDCDAEARTAVSTAILTGGR